MNRRSYLTSIGVVVGTASSAGCLGILGGSSDPLTVTNTSTTSEAGAFVVKATVENTTESPQKGKLITKIKFSEIDRTESKERAIAVAAGDSRTISVPFFFTSAVSGEAYTLETNITGIEAVQSIQQGPTISGTVDSTAKQAPWPAPYYSNQNTNFNPDASGPRERPEVVGEIDTGFSNPLVIGEDVIVSGGSAYQRDTGEALWFGIDTAWPPVIDGDIVYYSTSESFLAFDAVSEEILWEGKNWYGIPAVADGTVFVANLGSRNIEGALAALDGETGEILWEVDAKSRVRSPPAVADETVIFPSSEGAIGVDRASGERLWTGRTPVGFAGYAAVAYGVAYLTPPGDEQLVARDPRTGDFYWSQSIPGSGGLELAIGRETVVIPRTGSLVAFDAADGSLKWKNEVEGEYAGVPSIAGNTVYHGTSSGAIRAFDVDSGEQLFSYELSEGVEETLPVADGQLYVNPSGSNAKILE